MADTEVKASPSLCANEPPIPPSSTAPASPLPDATMQANHVQPLAITARAYRAIADLNSGFEQDISNLEALQRFNFFPAENLISWGNMIRRLQGEASRRLIHAIHSRLMNNVLYYDRLCWQRERELEDPVDVLLEAERRRWEITQEQQHQELK